MSKTLVAYFSASGSTAKLAKTLASAAEAELYEIKPAVPFFTSGGSDLGEGQGRIEVLAKGAKVKRGKRCSIEIRSSDLQE